MFQYLKQWLLLVGVRYYYVTCALVQGEGHVSLFQQAMMFKGHICIEAMEIHLGELAAASGYGDFKAITIIGITPITQDEFIHLREREAKILQRDQVEALGSKL